MGFRIDGKVAVVTGGGRDIGAACALELARQGADVVVNYHRSAAAAAGVGREIQALGRRAAVVEADVTQPAGVERLVRDALDFGRGRIDILVNNTGGLVRRARLSELTLELLEEVLRLNFTSALLMTQAVLPAMERQGGGKVIMVSSVAGANGGSVTTPHYGPAKAAMTNLARTLTKEYAAKNIQVNSVAPGVIDTRFHATHTSRDVWEAMLKNIPAGRAGTADEVAGVVAFLASPAADYLSGEVIHVNGGMHFGQ
ncbi:MAG: SDR family NAD(P)-dependent oxidoreductase [Thermoanaerobaculia bacterium]